jgi:phosphoglucosamine mutase
MGKLFGTDGIRGIAGDFPLDEQTVAVIGASLARIYQEKLGRAPRFLSGRDTRESGPAIERALHSGAVSVGAECVSAGVITTPGVAYLADAENFDAGIVISASHNPYHDNGIKIFIRGGKKADSEIEEAIEQDIANSSKEKTDFVHVELDESRAAVLAETYESHLLASFDDMDLGGKTIVIDCANGAASDIAPEVFRRIGANVVAINNSPDGKNINENCGSLHLEGLQAAVVENAAAIGIAFDGDADRALFVDERGEIVDGDGTLWVIAGHLLDHGKLANRKVVATVMSNLGLEIALREREVELVRTAVGDKHVLEELLRSESDVGGEQSGHIIFPKESLVGDGIVTALTLIETMAERNQSLSEMLSEFVKYPQILVNVKVREKRPFDTVPEIAEAAKVLEKELDGHGRLLLRYSGTENLARVMIEGKDQNEITKQANYLAEIIRSSLN